MTIIPILTAEDGVLTAALKYSRAGLYVCPIKRGSKHPGSVLGGGWTSKTSRDPAVVRLWFTGTTHGVAIHVGRSGLLAFDIDHPEAVPAILADAIRTCNPPFQSSRPGMLGKGHYLFSQPQGVELGNGKGGLHGDWGDVRGMNGIIVVAPTRHKDFPDGEYCWQVTGDVPELPPTLLEALTRRSISASDIARNGTLHVTKTKNLATCSVPAVPSPHPLPDHVEKMLATGRSPNGEGDRSRLRMTLAHAFYSSGRSLEDFTEAVTDPTNRASRWWSTDPDGQARDPHRLIKTDWEKAVAFRTSHASTSNATENRERLAVVRASVLGAEWTGVRGTRNRDCLLVMLDRAMEIGTVTLHASVRDIAERSGRSRSTVSRAIKDLKSVWLTVKSRGTRASGMASEYRFAVPAGTAERHDLADVRHTTPNDYWAGVGPVCRRVYDSVLPTPQTRRELARRSGLSEPTVGKHLRGLLEDGWVERPGPTAWRRSDLPDEDTHARDLLQDRYPHLMGTIERQRLRHETERAGYYEAVSPQITQRETSPGSRGAGM